MHERDYNQVVSTPLARRILAVLDSKLGLLNPIKIIPVEEYEASVNELKRLAEPPLDNPGLHNYRLNLRWRLNHSDLALRLIDPWWHNALLNQMPVVERVSLRLFRGKSLQAAISRVADHLDWFIDADSRKLARVAYVKNLSFAGIMLAGMLSIMLVNNPSITNMTLKMLAWFFLIVAITFIPWAIVIGAVQTRFSHAIRLQAIYIELFAYLREAYRDVN